MKHSLIALISLLVLPLFSCQLMLSPSDAVDTGKKQSTQTVKKESSIAFTTWGYQDNKVKANIFTVKIDRSDRRELTSTLNIIASQGNITKPVWSPNAQRLAFVQLSANGAYIVYTVNADGSGLTKLFSDDKCSPISAEFYGVWSSDSQNLVFEKTCPFNNPKTGYGRITELYVSDTTRSSQTRLIRRWIYTDVNKIESNIAISPNGKQVVFFEGQIAYQMNADGTKLARLAALPDSKLTRYSTFVWSPDSTYIARLDRYLEKPDEQQIYLLNTNGKLLNQAKTRGSLGTVRVLWSPDSTRLAYYQQESPNAPFTEGNIYLLDIKGAKPKNLTQQRDTYFGLSWSPDSKQITLVTRKQGIKLDLINIDASGSISLTSGFSAIFNPMWSADGQQIAFTGSEQSSSPKKNGPVFNLYVMNRDGSGLKQLSDDRDLSVTNFVWQP
ncbi:PD40 domain-containing protein [Desmonostoc muscorum CCALA 125]|nr:PD40 domain-containing protein [Desmonostoc muscorum CCALA 125]